MNRRLEAILPASLSSVSLLVAAINETASLRKTLDILKATCAPADIEEVLLLLSPTKTAPACRAVAEALVAESTPEFPVRIVYQSLPFAGGAYRDGFAAAKGSHAVILSADLETPPDLVRTMIELERKEPRGIVTASRWRKGGDFQGYNRVKLVCNAIFQKAISALFLTRLSDLTYAYRIFPTALLRAIDWKELRHPLFLETSVVPLRLGVPFTEIPAHWRQRVEGDSQNSFFANFRYFRTAFRVRFARADSLLRKG